MHQIGKFWVERPSLSVVRCLENNEEYHSGMVRYATSFCSKYRRAVDVGACYGLISLQMSSVFEKVEAYEPHSVTFECLKRNTEHDPRITLHHVGLSNTSDYKTIYYHDNDGRTSFVKPYVDKVVKYRTTLETESVTNKNLR